MQGVNGLHHVTAIAGPAQENLDFYTGILGLRLVKKSVNQDDPSTYHLFYADAEGHPGSDLTFFPWSHLAPSRKGHGLAVEVSLAVPPGSLGYWESRLEEHGTRITGRDERFGNSVLQLVDPHGLEVSLVQTEEALKRDFSAWDGSPVPVEKQIRGLESARLWERDLIHTTSFLTSVLGFRHLGTEKGWHRYGVSGGSSGRYLDLREAPDVHRGAWGVGSIHHLAWRVDNEEHQQTVRAKIEEAGRRPTPMIDRFWFKSVYFLEPGGVLFELATDGPGFAVDEDPAKLGDSLVLPPWLESQRAGIDAALPPLEYPTVARAN